MTDNVPTGASLYLGSTESSFITLMVSSGHLAKTSVKVPPRSMANLKVPPEAMFVVMLTADHTDGKPARLV